MNLVFNLVNKLANTRLNHQDQNMIYRSLKKEIITGCPAYPGSLLLQQNAPAQFLDTRHKTFYG